MTAIDDLYQVEDGVDDVVAADHNTNVLAIQFLNNTFGGQYNFGNGKDGHLKLGVISALTTTAPTVTTASGSGNLTGTFYYKYSAYNLSGETLESSASSTISVAAGSVNIQIPGTLNNTNITGFHIYRSIDNVTYYRVGTIPVDDATEGVVVNDNLPITSGTAPAGSNTTGVTATVSGTYRCKTLEVSAGQTLNVQDDSAATGGAGYLAIIANTSINVDGAIIGTGARRELLLNLCLTPGNLSNNNFLTDFDGNLGGKALVYDNSNMTSTGKKLVLSREIGWFGKQGIGSGSSSYAGGAIMLAAPEIDLSSGTITSNGSTGASDSAGGSGGLILNYANKLTLTSATLTATGGNGNTNGGGASVCAGGGGGIIINCADHTIGSSTSTVNAGANSAASNSSARSGGGFGGGGGTSPSVGLIISQVPNKFVMDNF